MLWSHQATELDAPQFHLFIKYFGYVLEAAIPAIHIANKISFKSDKILSHFKNLITRHT